MGNTPLTPHQQENVLSGRAICNDSYELHPAGCVSKAIWGTPRTHTGWKITNDCCQTATVIDVNHSGVDKMMQKLGAAELYEDFMDKIYNEIKHSCMWRQGVLRRRQEYVERFHKLGLDLWVCGDHCAQLGHDEFFILFVDRSVALNSVKDSLKWTYLLWGGRLGREEVNDQDPAAPLIEGLDWLKIEE